MPAPLSVREAIEQSGRKLRRKELRAFMDDGMTSETAAQLIAKHGNVGDKVQGFYDRRSEGSEEDENALGMLRLSQTPGQSLFTTANGTRVATRKDFNDARNGSDEFVKQHIGHVDGRYLVAGNKSGAKLNDYLEKTGYSLEPGKKGEWEQVGTRKLTVASGAESYGGTLGGTGNGAHPRPYNDSVHVGQHKEYVPIYRKLEKPEEPEAEETPATEEDSGRRRPRDRDEQPFGDGNFDEAPLGSWDTSNWAPKPWTASQSGSGAINTNSGAFTAGQLGPFVSSSSPDRPLAWSSAWDPEGPSWRDSAGDDEGTAFAGSRGFRDRMNRMALA